MDKLRHALIAIGLALIVILVTFYAYLALSVAEDQSSAVREQIRRGHDGLVMPRRELP